MTNSPHVPFFRSVIRVLEERGHKVLVTARDYAQTKGLLEKSGLDFTLIGQHQGKNKLNKLWGLFRRSFFLSEYSRNQRINVAVSLGSNDLALVAFLKGIPHLTIFDYEYITAHHINFRLSKLIMCPEAIPFENIKKFGAKRERFKQFPGLKENAYLGDFEPTKGFLEQMGIPDSKVIITIRPPATIAHYQSNENKLFDKLLDYLGTKENVICVVLPRIREQIDHIEAKALSNMIILQEAVDGLNLLWWSDIVISAGGTMNREAAALQVPVFSIYKDKFGAVDQMLVRNEQMVRLSSENDFALLPITKKRIIPKFGLFLTNLEFIVDSIEKLATTH